MEIWKKQSRGRCLRAELFGGGVGLGVMRMWMVCKAVRLDEVT